MGGFKGQSIAPPHLHPPYRWNKNVTAQKLTVVLHVCCIAKISLSNYAEPLFDLTAYINNPSLSDVVLISEDGRRFHAHRIVLCAQSLVLKTMLDSEVWADSKNKEVFIQRIQCSP